MNFLFMIIVLVSLVEVGKLKKDQVFQRISDAGNWHKIQYGNIDGYVREDFYRCRVVRPRLPLIR